MIGTSTMMNHAPCVNFVTATMISTRNDSAAPTPLTNSP